MGLRMVDIRADGHCMFRSLEDQLAQASASSTSPHTYQELRIMAAERIRWGGAAWLLKHLPVTGRNFNGSDFFRHVNKF